MKLTNNENVLIKAIVFSDYRSGRETLQELMEAVWVENPFPSKRTLGGVMSSLVKKGLANVYEYDPGQMTVNLTPMGAEVALLLLINGF